MNTLDSLVSAIKLTNPTTRTRYEAATKYIDAWSIIDATGSRYGSLVITRKATASGHMVRAFFHIYGSPMAEGKAKGGGYDMSSAALVDALRNAWPTMAVHDRARLVDVLPALESRQVENALDLAKSLRFIRCI